MRGLAFDGLPSQQESEIEALRASLREAQGNVERLWGERLLVIHGLDIMGALDAGGDFVDTVLAAAGRTRTICKGCKAPGVLKAESGGWVCNDCYMKEHTGT